METLLEAICNFLAKILLPNILTDFQKSVSCILASVNVTKVSYKISIKVNLATELTYLCIQHVYSLIPFMRALLYGTKEQPLRVRNFSSEIPLLSGHSAQVDIFSDPLEFDLTWFHFTRQVFAYIKIIQLI